MIEPHDHHIFYEREAERDRLEQAGEDCRDDIPDNDGAWATVVPPVGDIPVACNLCHKTHTAENLHEVARWIGDHGCTYGRSIINWTPCPDCGQTLCHGECTQ